MSVNTVVRPEADGSFHSTLRGQEQAQSQFQRVQSRGFTPSIKLTAELPEHPDDKLFQRLWFAVLLNPAENTGGEFLEAAH